MFRPEDEAALTAFRTGRSGLRHEANRLDVRQCVTRRAEHRIALFGARRTDIEGFGRQPEVLGRVPATTARRLRNDRVLLPGTGKLLCDAQASSSVSSTEKCLPER